MEYLALYRKYRPIKFDEILGQNKIIETIHNSIINNKISHAYLFFGPRGTGKTTTAKLIAKMVNCLNPIDGEPCGKCESCISIANNSNDDIIEIDAASNNGVDEIREIRDKVNFVPLISKYKVYIIDEVHMLSIGAFNALLKTLEEPPKHVIFILATTEEHKIPLTISSRCQKFNFTKISVENIVENLNKIAKLENIDVNKEVLRQIAIFSDGGMRDAINMFDQLISYKNGNITLDDVYEINGNVTFSEICTFFNFLYDKSVVDIIDFIDSCDVKGKNLFRFIDELIEFSRDLLIYKLSPNLIVDNSKIENFKLFALKISDELIYNLIDGINQLLIDIKNSSYPKLLIQVFFIKLVSLNENVAFKNKIISQETKSREIKLFPENNDKNKNADYFPGNNQKDKNTNNSTNVLVENIKNELSNELKKIRINNCFATANKEELNYLKDKWKNISDYLFNDEFGVVVGMLQDSVPVVAGPHNLILLGKNNSTVERINQSLIIISSMFKKIYNKDYLILALNEEEWNVEKSKFVKNRHLGVYKYVDEKDIVSLGNVGNKLNKNVNNDINDLINIVGSDIIEYK